MLIDRYAKKAADELHWWLDRLRREDKDKLLLACRAYGEGQLVPLQPDFDGLIDRLLSVGPRERELLLRKQNLEIDRHLVLLVACHQAHCAWLWLEHASMQAADPSVNIHPREMARRAARAADDFYQNYPSLWPFDDEE